MYTNEQLNAIHYSKIGIEFEFFSNFDLKKTKEELSNLFGKKIRIEEKAHSDFAPTYDTWKMEPDNSGGSGMIELVTGSLPYAETKIVIAKMLKWIKENGSTNDKCSIHINISFDGEKLGPVANISKLDIGKFVLNFDEDAVANDGQYRAELRLERCFIPRNLNINADGRRLGIQIESIKVNN